MSAPVLAFGLGGLLGGALLAQRGTHVLGPSKAQCDITDLKAVRFVLDETAKAYGPLAKVINCAAFASVDACETYPKHAFEVNALGAENIAVACAERDLPLVHISTDYVFGADAPSGGWVETDPIEPLQSYGRSKAHGEAYVLAEHPKASILRVSGLYSLRGAGILGRTLKTIASTSTFPLVARQVFCPTAVEDVAAAALALSASGTWHFAGPPTSRLQIASSILSYLRRPIRVELVDAFPGLPARRPRDSSLGCAKFKAAYGLSARSWVEGLRSVVAAPGMRPKA